MLEDYANNTDCVLGRMINHLFMGIIYIACCSVTCLAQPLFDEHLLLEDIYQPARIELADFDGDGDLDILPLNWSTIILWLENVDGFGHFSIRDTLEVVVDHPFSMKVIDIDSDGDMDILGTAQSNNEIFWFCNLDGAGSFGVRHVLSTNVVTPMHIVPSDVDNDGDWDIVIDSFEDRYVAWLENLDGQQSFGVPSVINSNVYFPFDLSVGDIDGDFDIDVIATAGVDNKVIWHENLDGYGAFGDQNVINEYAFRPTVLQVVDLDGDLDLDVISAASYEGRLFWHENIDGLGSFGPEHIISGQLAGINEAIVIDMDNDGDLDIVASASHGYNNDFIAGFENDGFGNFGEPIFLTTTCHSSDLAAVDLDRDGDIDLISANKADNNITWYENLLQTAPIRVYLTEQRQDGSQLIDIFYNLSQEPGFYYITIEASLNGGANYLPISNATGDVSFGVTPGNGKHIVWDIGAQYPNQFSSTTRIRIHAIANDTPQDAMVDIDGNVYQTVQVGNQVWMAENLKVTHYRNGDPISTAMSSSDGAHTVYNNNINNELDTYGTLYNWAAAVDARYVAPAGWHVPSDDEWKELEIFLGMSQTQADSPGYRGTNEGSKLSGNSELWIDGALVDNSEFGSTGFAALPGGYLLWSGNYYNIGGGGYFWTSTEDGNGSAWHRRFDSDGSGITRDYGRERDGFSVRCIRD